MADHVNGTLAFAGTVVQAAFENNTFAFTYHGTRRVHAASDILSCAQPCVPSDAQEIGVASGDEQRSFTVYAVDRNHGNGLWRLIRYSFACTSDGDADQWVQALHGAIARQTQRPRRLLAIVNPYGGRGNAVKVYESGVAPVLVCAGIEVDVVHTQRSQHAREVTNTRDFSAYDGICVVGGDGLFNEVVNGLLTRPQPYTHLRIGLIPAGSTNCIVYSTTGHEDVQTAALHIVLGTRMALDMICLWDWATRRRLLYAASMVAYGFYGDVVHSSEALRWLYVGVLVAPSSTLGPARYTVSGASSVLANRAYAGTVYMRGAAADGASRTLCKNGCTQCPPDPDKPDVPPPPPQWDDSLANWERVEGNFICVNAAVMSCKCENSPNGMAPFAHLSDGYMNLVLVKETARPLYLLHLLTLKNDTADHLNYSFVEGHRVKEFVFTTDLTSAADASKWVADGELLTSTQVYCRTHSNLVHLFASRPLCDPPAAPRPAATS